MFIRRLGGILKTGFLAVVLALCLFGDCAPARTALVLGTVVNEVVAACRDPGTQWMVAVCLLTYWGTFLLLEHRLGPGARFWRAGNADCWLVALGVIVSLRYAFDYPAACRSTQLLVLMAGLVVGKGAAVGCRWAGSRAVRPRGLESRTSETLNPALRNFVVLLVLLLLAAALWHPANPRSFAYLDQARWSGPWDNPNTYGLLMGVGLVLALGLAACEMLEWRRRWRWRRGMAVAAWGLVAVVLAVGLLESYSRGAWVGTVLGLTYLGYQAFRSSGCRAHEQDQGSRGEGAKARSSQGSTGSWWLTFFRRNRVPVAVAVLSLAGLGFYSLRQTEWRVARRVVSLGNANDFSWRNRVAAWEGAVQIMADYPWLGAGWNQPESLYRHFYMPPRIEEGMAIQLNDYFTLGMTLGLPALLFFSAGIGLAFKQGSKARRPASETARSGSNADANPQLATLNLQLLRAACHAGAIVLLTGFWFDGGLFKLPTAVPFWMLLALGALNAEGGDRSATSVGAGIRLNHWRPLGWAVLGLLLIGGALFWAKGRDPFVRSWFEVKVAPTERVNCVAVLPKPVRARPIVVYLHGAGGALPSDGPDLKQIAEMGLAVVSVEYDPTNAAAGDRQFAAVLAYLGRQHWADPNAVAWAGLDLGANRVLSFALRHPAFQPRLLVCLAGGEVEELKPSRNAEVGVRNGKDPASAPTARLRCPVVLVRGAEDELFPLAEAEQVAFALRSQGVGVELKSLAGLGHAFGAERGVVFRAVGTECLTCLAGADAWTGYRSLAQWQAAATPLWRWWLPAALWMGARASWSWRSRRRAAGLRRQKGQLAPAELGLRIGAGALALAALALIAIHWVTPRLPMTRATLGLARQFLVPPRARADFDWLSPQVSSQGQRVGTVLEAVTLANYNRRLVNWHLDDALYRQFVLSPMIESGRPVVAADWRRPLWESLYPRIRKESSPVTAAQVVVRHLRERVTILPEDRPDADVPTIWRQQETTAAGFARLCVAALRSVGIAARLNGSGEAQFWNTEGWVPVPTSAASSAACAIPASRTSPRLAKALGLTTSVLCKGVDA